jgi:hypothetical protein
MSNLQETATLIRRAWNGGFVASPLEENVLAPRYCVERRA